MVTDRAARECEIALFLGKIALENEQKVFRPSRRAGGEDAVEHWFNDLPNLAPAVAARPAEKERMLAAPQKRDESVVVELCVCGFAPPDHNGMAGPQADADSCFFKSAAIARPGINPCASDGIGDFDRAAGRDPWAGCRAAAEVLGSPSPRYFSPGFPCLYCRYLAFYLAKNASDARIARANTVLGFKMICAANVSGEAGYRS